MFKWMPMPYKAQDMCEKKLKKVMKHLKIENYYFNWDRSSCFIEFTYQENFYRMEHSVQKAIEKGIVLRTGLDCLNELIQSLENLCQIINRGTYQLGTWLSGLKQLTFTEEIPKFSGRSLLENQKHSEEDSVRIEDFLTITK